jgi:DeoR family transcriptional regulator, myo-inositol catabolism operon repressor
MTYCSLNDIDYLVTDKKPSDMYIEYAGKNGIELIIAE